MRKIYLIIILIISNFTNAQNEVFMKPQITPQAPNVASLGIYGDFSFGHYSGTPDIKIPLYEIDLDGLKIPIQLKYNASGIKVAQEASWVGLGWSLTAGGNIAKEIRGWNDFGGNDVYNSDEYAKYFGNYHHWYDNGYYLNDLPVFPPRNLNDEIDPSYGTSETDPDSWNQEERLKLYKLMALDTQPDIFHFNFGSYSGSMYFDRDTKTSNKIAKPIVRTPISYLDITYDIEKSSWTIIDPYGYKFHFQTIDITEVHDFSLEYGKPTSFYTNNKREIPGRVKMPTAATNWYLDSIVSPKGKKVTFHYERELFSTPVMFTELLMLNKEIGAWKNNFNFSYSVFLQNVLKKIEFEGGTVEFHTSSNRQDLDEQFYDNFRLSVNALSPQRLDIMEVKDKLNNPIKKYQFDYRYMGNKSNYLSCRLMLNSVTEKSNDIKGGAYKFSYIPGTLPDKNALETDLWGYYNGPYNFIRGTGNTFYGGTLPPYIHQKYNYTSDVKKVKMTGGRMVMPNFEYAPVGTLEKIQYPTGGKTEFRYEPHQFDREYVYYEGEDEELVLFTHYPMTRESDLNKIQFIEEFTLTETCYIGIRSSYYYHYLYPDHNNPPNRCVTTWLHKILPDEKVELIIDETFIMDKQGDSRNSSYYYWLEPGRYRFTANKEPYVINKYHFEFAIKKINRKKSSIGGGLRVKEIHNTDHDNIVTKKKYTYQYYDKETNEMIPTGMLLLGSDYEELLGLEYHIDPIIYIRPRVFSADNLFAGKSSPENIGYWYVEEHNEDSLGNTNGKTSYEHFLNQTIKHATIPGYPYDFDPRNGTLLRTCTYDKDGVIVNKTQKKHSIKEGQTTKLTEALITYYDSEFRHTSSKFYDLKSERWVLDKETIITYFNKKNDSIINEVNYQYHPSYWMPINETSTGSKGEKIENRLKYPIDYTDEISTRMKSRNMVAIPVEKVTLVDNAITSVSRTLHCDTLGMILPRFSYISDKQLPTTLTNYSQYIQNYKSFVSFEKYDNKGNPLHLIGDDNIPITYVWGYNGLYPVAEIKNVPYSMVKILLGETFMNNLLNQNTLNASDIQKLNNLRNRSQFKNAVKTYTYKPLIGISTETDQRGMTTHHEYDIFNRPKKIYRENKDRQKQVIQTYDYNYRNQ